VLNLLPIDERGLAVGLAGELPADAAGAAAATAEFYGRSGFRPPWIGYVAVVDGVAVGTCSFKGAPQSGRVEIAYFTLPGHEGRGFAMEMARRLVGLARAADPRLAVSAQTLPAESASTTILRRLGFVLARTLEHPEDGTVWEWELEPPAA